MAVTILVGDARGVLATLPEKSVQLCVTSPPYWNLRAYGVGAENGELGSEDTPEAYVANLVEVFGAVKRVLRDDGLLFCNLGDSYAGSGKGPTGHNGIQNAEKRQGFGSGYSLPCPSCAEDRNGRDRAAAPGIPGELAEVGRLGHVANGAGSGKGVPVCRRCKGRGYLSSESGGRRNKTDAPAGYQAKDLMMMPARVALALQADGWILRSCMPWIKASAMPESVQDRPSSALEYVFLFSKKARYYWDATAVRQTSSRNSHGSLRVNPGEKIGAEGFHHNGHGQTTLGRWTTEDSAGGRAFRNTDLFRISVDDRIVTLRAEVARLEAQRDAGGLLLDEDGDPLALDVNPAAFKEKHFATFPEKLVLPLIKAGTSERGACPTCGAAWVRVVERVSRANANGSCGCGTTHGETRIKVTDDSHLRNDYGDGRERLFCKRSDTTGWAPSCPCYDVRYRAEFPQPRRARKREQRAAWNGQWRRVRARPGGGSWPVEPCTVLDPFSGAGTTGLVASRLGRDSIGVELSPVYAAMSESRIRDDAPLLTDVVTTGPTKYAPLGLFGEVTGAYTPLELFGAEAPEDDGIADVLARLGRPTAKTSLELFGEVG